jgi:Zn-dependent M28 family amino/carboxypeptidase
MSGLRDGTTLRFFADTRTAEPTAHTWNAVARLTGSDPALSKDVIVLSAHLDHVGMRPTASGADKIYNGADDDASGTVAVMALAHALAQGARPKRTIVFALFGSEETGGRGAGFFVDLPVVPLEQIVADLQFEMLGRPDPLVPAKSLWLTGYERSNLGAELARQGARLVADPRPDQSFFTRSDNIRFARRGVVAHTVSSFNLHKEYHQPSDEIGLIDFAHMTEAVRSLLEPVRWLANSAFRPEWAPNGCPAPCK